MTINFTFNDFDEMEATVVRMARTIEAAKAADIRREDAMLEYMDKVAEGIKEAVPSKAAAKAAKEAPNRPGSNVPEQPSIPPMPKPEKAEEAPRKAEEAPQKAEEAAPKVDRVELRKILSVLNKTTGENTARKLINEMGFRVLTEVPDDRLAELKAKAEEVINA